MRKTALNGFGQYKQLTRTDCKADPMLLYKISYSPWSLRARWALRHHGVPVTTREYIPMVGTLGLHWRLRELGKITIPVLIDGDRVLRDLFDIARLAEERGTGASLFSDGEAHAREWMNVADQLAEAGRALTTFAVLEDREAMLENVPAFVPKSARRMSAGAVVRSGALYLAKKYSFTQDQHDQHRAHMRSALERAQQALKSRDTVGSAFGWADICLVCGLQFVQPATGWARLGPASQRCWTQPALVRDFGDVLQWRDRILAEHKEHAGIRA